MKVYPTANCNTAAVAMSELLKLSKEQKFSEDLGSAKRAVRSGHKD